MPIFVVWQLSIMFLISFAIVVFFVITRSRKTMLYISRYLAIFAAIAGFSIYTIGYLQPHYSLSDIPNAAMRAVVSTIGMLFLSTDYSELSEWLAENFFREIFFWGIHLTAFIVIQAAFISIFGRRIQDYCRLRFGFHKELYIINGCSKNALMLGEDITGQRSDIDKQKRAASRILVVFVLNDEDDKKQIYEKVMHFGGIVQVLDNRHNLNTFLRITGLGKRFRKNRIFHIVYMPNEISTVRDVTEIVEYANKENKKRHDSVLPDNLRFYVLTSCDLERIAIERITQNKNEGKRVYPYYFRIHSEEGLLARQIIEKEPPFNFNWFKFDKKYRFKILVLGFGTMGENALLQILRNVQLYGSKVRVIIVDKDKHLIECFKRRYPTVERLCCEKIVSIESDVRSDECIVKTIDEEKPDYIIVSYSNDKDNLDLTHDISKRYNKLKHETIPVIAVLQKYNRKEDIHEKMYNINILFFGNEREIYKKSIIISEDNDKKAKALFYSWKENGEWNSLDWVSQESERASADFMQGMYKLIGFDNSETFHFNEKNWNSEIKEYLAITEHKRWCAFYATMGFDLIEIKDLQSRYDNFRKEGLSINDSLARCRKDVENRLHANLVPWEDLEKLEREYNSVTQKATNSTDGKRYFKQEYYEIIEEIRKTVEVNESK